MPEEQNYHYIAFISYCHVERDRKWAQWLINALESYRVPKELQTTGFPSRLGRVFRDKDELSSDGSLNSQIDDALKASKFLIVICSRHTPYSKWVAREIEIFKELGRGDKIVPLLVEGEPDESYPRVLTTSKLISFDEAEANTPIKDVDPSSADVRPVKGKTSRETKKDELLRIVASLLGCTFYELKHRDNLRQKKALRMRILYSLVATMVALVFIGFSAYQTQQASKEKQLKQQIADSRKVEAIREIEAQSQLIAKLASQEPDPITSALLAMEAWNYHDPRSEYRAEHYLDLDIVQRAQKLQYEWRDNNHHDPKHQNAAAILKAKLSSNGETYYRYYKQGFAKTVLSHDDQYIAEGFEDGSIYIEDLENNKLIVNSQADGPINVLQFSKRENAIHIVTNQSWLKVDLDTLKTATLYRFDKFAPHSIAIADSERAAAITTLEGEVHILSLDTGKSSLFKTFNLAPRILWPTRYLFIGTATGVEVYDVEKDEKVLDHIINANVSNITLSQDHKAVVYVVDAGYVKIFDTDKGDDSPIYKIPDIKKAIDDVHFANKSNTLITSIGKTIQLRHSGVEEVREIGCKNQTIRSLTLSRDENWLGAGTSKGTVCVWDMETLALKWVIQLGEKGIAWLEFGVDGETIYLQSKDGILRGWRWTTPRDIKSYPACEKQVGQLYATFDAKQLLLNSGAVGLCHWNVDDGFSRTHYPRFILTGEAYPVSPLIERVVFIDRDGKVFSADTKGFDMPIQYLKGKSANNKASNRPFLAAGFSGNSTEVIARNIRGEVYIWPHDQPDNPTLLSERITTPLSIVHISNSDRYVTFTDSKGVGYIFNRNSGELVTKIDLPSKLNMIVTDNQNESVDLILQNGDAYNLTFKQLDSVEKEILDTGKLVVLPRTIIGSFYAYLPNIEAGDIVLYDVIGGSEVYRINDAAVGMKGRFASVTTRVTEDGLWIFAMLIPDDKSKDKQLVALRAPQVINVSLSKKLEQEIPRIQKLPYDQQLVMADYWRSIGESKVYHWSKSQFVRCLTPRQRRQYKLNQDPPCWCKRMPYPTISDWHAQLGYDPFTDRRTNGDRCETTEPLFNLSLEGTK